MMMNPHRLATTLVATLALTASVWMAPAASAQSAKIGAVDMRKLYEEFYKTKAAQRSFDDSVAAYKKDHQQRLNDYNKLNEEASKLREEAANPALTQEKRDQKAKQLQDKILELRKAMQAVQEFEQNSQQYLNDLRRRQNDSILKDIVEAVRKKGRDGGYTLIVDNSGFGTIASVPMAVYVEEKLDFTDMVLKELNANAPALPPGGAGPGPATLPVPSTTPRTPTP